MRNKAYWEDRLSRSIYAKKLVKRLYEKYEDELQDEIAHTKMYSAGDVKRNISNISDGTLQPLQSFLNTDTVSAVFAVKEANPDKRVAVLNFASYKNPGGMFLEGSKAQEECLCAQSTLYPVLDSFRDTYYAENNKHLNRALYTDRALYTPDVLFAEKGRDNVRADVLTCAAPNHFAAFKYNKGITEEDNRKVLTSRMAFMRNILEENKADIWILGAWGCGVFAQDAKEVAESFKAINETADCEHIIYAVPRNDKTAAIFRDVFDELSLEMEDAMEEERA